VFDDYLFDSYFIVQQKGAHNFKIKNGATAGVEICKLQLLIGNWF
jgi:hypothetical protein